MKTQINVCIDVEVAKELKKEKNVSFLINSYLKSYFGLNNLAKLEAVKEPETTVEKDLAKASL